MNYSVIIPAAGCGSRMGAEVPKVLLRLSEAASSPSIIQRAVDIFVDDPQCVSVVVCVPPEWRERHKVALIPGGATRQESVRLGVESLSASVVRAGGDLRATCVLVHDAARCCVSRDVIHRVVEGVRLNGAVTAAVPVPDSLCRVADGAVSSFVDRDSVWAIQTPQGFLLDELRSAHFAARTDGFVALDDASVVARIRDVRVVEGDRLNIKVTHPQDLGVAARIAEVG